MSQQWLMTCARCADMPDPHVPGTTTEACQFCGAKVWVAPSTTVAIKKHNASPVWCCMKCAVDMAATQRGPIVREVLRESTDEALRVYGDTPANRKFMGDVVEMLTGKRPTDD